VAHRADPAGNGSIDRTAEVHTPGRAPTAAHARKSEALRAFAERLESDLYEFALADGSLPQLADHLGLPRAAIRAAADRGADRRPGARPLPRSNLAARRCRLCRWPFKPGRVDQHHCSKRCVRVAHRERVGDPTVDATIAWLRDPPNCEGCGEPLRDTRVGARFHGDACHKRAQRRRQPGDAAALSGGPAVR
jgi:hypothetical protein